MDESQSEFLKAFPNWLRSLGEDAEALSALLGNASIPESAREFLGGGLNYLFKSLDLIPDGIDDIGFLDDAFILRVAADFAAQEVDDVNTKELRILATFSNDCDLIRKFLGNDYGRLEAYVRSLRKGAARGRSVNEVLADKRVLTEFQTEVGSFARGYVAPAFSQDGKNLIKMKAFFDAKLPK